MALAQLTGVRGLQTWKFTLAVIGSKAQNVFSAEFVGSLRGTQLQKVSKALDAVAAAKQNARWRLEHTDAFCLARDFRYGRRSRRWLAAKALRSKFDQAYAEYAVFLNENVLLNPDLAKLPSQDINVLSQKPFSDIMKP